MPDVDKYDAPDKRSIPQNTIRGVALNIAKLTSTHIRLFCSFALLYGSNLRNTSSEGRQNPAFRSHNKHRSTAGQACISIIMFAKKPAVLHHGSKTKI